MAISNERSMPWHFSFAAIANVPVSRWRAANRDGSGVRPIIGFLIGMIALFAALSLVLRALGVDTYSGGDGKFNQDLITSYLAFGRPFQVNTVNPLEGVFSQLYPLNVWLNPGFLPFFIFDHDTALLVSTAVFLFIYCLAIYALARTVDASMPTAVIGAQFGAFAFPPLYYTAGLFSNYDLNPGVSLTVALFTALLCVILRVREVSWRSCIVALTLSITLVGCIVYNDPLTMGLLGFSFTVPFGIAILEGKRVSVIGLRLLVLAITGGVFYMLGFIDYVLAMDHYTARYYLRQEFFRPQTPDFVSALFDFPQAGRTYAFLLLGWLMGLLFCRGRQRLIIVMAVLNFVWILIYGSAYLFGSFHWFAPLPVYVETYTIHIAGLAAVIGWAALVRHVVKSRPAASLQVRIRPHLKPVAAFAAAIIVPVLVAIYALRIPASMYGSNHEDWVDEAELVNHLRDKVGLADGLQFRGSVYVNVIGYRDQLTYLNLWHNLIPTFNEYSQTLTPAYGFFGTRVLIATLPDTEHMKGLFSSARQFVIESINITGLAAVGTRFLLVTDQSLERLISPRDGQAFLRGEFIGRTPRRPDLDRKWYLYELAHPNQGQFSPTAVRVATTASRMVDLMRKPEFDWTHEVLLTEPIGETLTSARNVRMIVRRGTVEVEADTDGPALLVLPIQYSHCLALDGARNARLIRADFLLTGLLLTEAGHTTMRFDYGFFNAACRRADSRDMELMEVHSDDEAVVGERHQNPFAITSWRMIPTKILGVLGQLKFL